MIAKVTHGQDMGGLVRYLLDEEGKDNEHTDSHPIAASDGIDVPVGRPLTDTERADLVGMLNLSRDLYGSRIKGGHVYHVSLSTKGGTDRQLTDDEWAEVARTAMVDLGFDGPGVASPCSWVAIRHGLSGDGNDHMHLAVSRVREGGGTASIHNDWLRWERFCARMEVRFGLTVVQGRRNRAGMPGVTRAELGKAKRTGHADPERVEVARAVRAAALASRSEDEFVRRLRAAGLAVAPRYEKTGRHRVVGYSVARPPTDGGTTVFFKGGQLARDLTLPALRRGWDQTADATQAAAAEWGQPTVEEGTEPAGGVHRMGWDEASVRWGPGRLPVVGDGPGSQRWAPGEWDEATRRLGQVVRDLRQVPADDQAAWAEAAQDAAGLMANLSARLEPTPGPLAKASDALARSAQTDQPRARARTPFVPTGTLRTVAAVMAQAQITDEVALGWQLMLAELLRLSQAIHEAHQARGEALRAEQLVADARAALDQARTQLASPERLAELVPAVAARVAEATDAERDDQESDPRRRRRGPGGAMRPDEYAALATRRQRSTTPDRTSDAGR